MTKKTLERETVLKSDTLLTPEDFECHQEYTRNCFPRVGQGLNMSGTMQKSSCTQKHALRQETLKGMSPFSSLIVVEAPALIRACNNL